MGSIISFIFGHWYLVAIVFFILSMFSKGSRKQAKPMPPFGGEGARPSAGKRFADAEARPKQQQASPLRSQTALQKQQPRLTDTQPQVHKTSLKTMDTAMMPKEVNAMDNYYDSEAYKKVQENIYDHSPVTEERAAESQPGARQLEANQLAQGIAWAEILGPPRARKPYGKLR
jgi:hypothetical protein